MVFLDIYGDEGDEILGQVAALGEKWLFEAAINLEAEFLSHFRGEISDLEVEFHLYVKKINIRGEIIHYWWIPTSKYPNKNIREADYSGFKLTQFFGGLNYLQNALQVFRTHSLIIF